MKVVIKDAEHYSGWDRVMNIDYYGLYPWKELFKNPQFNSVLLINAMQEKITN